MRLERPLAVITVLIFAGCVGGAGMTATPAAVVPSTPGASSNESNRMTSDNGLQFDSTPGNDGQDDASQAPTTATKSDSTSASAPRFGGGRFLFY